MLARWTLTLGLLGLACAANAALLLRNPEKPRLPQGEVRVDLAGLTMTVPRALIQEPSQQGGGRLVRLDLAVTPQGFEPLPPPHPDQIKLWGPERVQLVLTNPGMQAPPADQLQQLYARFLTPETLNTPAGLMLRRFRPGTPYEDRELFIGAGQLGGGLGRLFIALCPKAGPRDIEPCTARLRQDGVEIEMRFPAQWLGQWRRIGAEAVKLVSRLRGTDQG